MSHQRAVDKAMARLIARMDKTARKSAGVKTIHNNSSKSFYKYNASNIRTAEAAMNDAFIAANNNVNLQTYETYAKTLQLWNKAIAQAKNKDARALGQK